MNVRSCPTLLCAILLLAGCADEVAPDPVGPADPATAASAIATAIAGQDQLSVLSYNLYVGADLDQVIGALVSPDPGDDFPALLHGIDVLEQTDISTRVEALADAIAIQRPDVAGLQEVWTIGIDLRPYGLPTVIDLDFQALLEAALAARGLHYAVAGRVQDTDASPLPGIRVTDHDIVLVDLDRVTVTGAISKTFDANIGPISPGISLLRGWISIQATVAGQDYTFVTTHLESGGSPQIAGLRALQASELVAVIGTAPRVVLSGDLNDTPDSPMYQVLTSGGLIDAWRALRPGAPGLTCCHAPDLSDSRALFDQRIDYLFGRGFEQAGRVLKGEIEVIDDRPNARIPGPSHPIWPSDHAGVAARLRTP